MEESGGSMASGQGGTAQKQGPAAATPTRKRPRSVVAWQSKAEWDQVMVGLYCGDCQMQEDALDRVSAWKSRYGHRMPLAVECTADLIRCKILDASGSLKSHELVLTYGLALVRFVNLITERKQKMVTVSLRRLAKELSLPVWMVDLRHDLTHGTLPQLSACRKGCVAGLEWLRRTYWSRQLGNNLAGECEEEEEESPTTDIDAEADSSPEEPNKLKLHVRQKHQELLEKATDVLVSYKNHQFGVLQELQSVDKAWKEGGGSSSEVQWIMAQMEDLLQDNREVVTGAMLRDGLLIPSVEDLQTLNVDLQETKEWDFRVPPTFLRFWQPLLTGLHSSVFTQILLEKMFGELKQHARESGLRTRYLISWITEILKTNKQAKKKSKGSSKRSKNRNKTSPVLFLHRVSLQWLKLLENCLEAPCWASPHLLHLILLSMEPPLPSETQERLLYLTSIYTQEDDSLPSPGSAADLRKQPIYTVENLQWKAKRSGAARERDKRARRVECPVEEEDLAEEEEEEEEEEMETQSAPLPESFHVESARALAEKRVALQGSAWQVSSAITCLKNLLKIRNNSVPNEVKLLETFFSSPPASNSEWNRSGAEGLLWTQSELHKLKSGLQLF
ncbi:PREDICTED: ribosomal biogenesis protein LAS1L [Gekko japonicus]|uniref:Ribosomal biogenesis protein LAS1L n=1 Tax=Gekko japonicus TaxID=146911 RepID=A0ABM1KBR0_GEKJA|nr:PREDICTED: ribosomal biogenesis protein LAS1L [Gekko japonicus]